MQRVVSNSESRQRRLVHRWLVATCLLATVSCGGGGSPAPTTPGSTTPTTTNTIVITAQGASPRSIQINVGTRVTMTNNDTRSHNMASDAHPEHTDCPELNQIGLLAPGQTRESGNLNTARTCSFHDHDNPATANLTGTITIR